MANDNVVRAPQDRLRQEKRTIFATSDTAQTVSSCSCSKAQDGKLTPVDITADKLTYHDEQRLARYIGNVLAKSADGTVSAEQTDVYLKPATRSREQPPRARLRQGPALPGSDAQPDRPHHRHRTYCGD